MMNLMGGAFPAGVSWTDVADPAALLQGVGGWVLLVVAVIVFIESGVLFPFLPGDSLIFTAGLLHVRLGLPLVVLIAVIVSAAVLGDQVGYWLGRRFGRRLFKPDARVLNTRYLTGAEEFFARYGGRSLVLARFVPFARTFVPLAAGTARYRYRAFLLWNVLGGLLWGAGLTIGGSLLGQVPFIADHIDLIAVVIVVVSVVPTIIEVIRHIRKNKTGTAMGPVVRQPGPTLPDVPPTVTGEIQPASFLESDKQRAPDGWPSPATTPAHGTRTTRNGSLGESTPLRHRMTRHWILGPLLITVLVFAAGMILKTDMFLAASDLHIVQGLSRHHTGALDAIALAIHAGLGGLSAWYFLVIVALAVAIYRRSATDGLFIVVLTVGGWALTTLMKVAVGRERPDPMSLADPLLPGVTGFTSFPSGHTAFAVSLGIAVSLVMVSTRWRVPVIVGAGAFGIVVGASRVYLGVHYLSDVVASLALSMAAALFLTGVMRLYRQSRLESVRGDPHRGGFDRGRHGRRLRIGQRH